MNIDDLKAPFPASAIHWRIGSTNKKRQIKETNNQNAVATKGLPLAYIDARDVMYRLDTVVGANNWQDKYVETARGRIICELSIKIDGEWVTKSDGAGDTGTEGEKGALSDAFKRAAVKFGIGRYLYSTRSEWIDLDRGYAPKGINEICAPNLVATGIEITELSLNKGFEAHMQAVLDNFESIDFIKRRIDEAQLSPAKEAWAELDDATKSILWRAPTKGGCFTTKERTAMRSNEWGEA